MTICFRGEEVQLCGRKLYDFFAKKLCKSVAVFEKKCKFARPNETIDTDDMRSISCRYNLKTMKMC